ncbi:DCN1-like protein 3 [Eurytemora carolleeae]|uniref:DCN1-like protein 3 n=1 Tax=Eurytemora carolleeae TaxID=1294199 RepID=UPI000C76CE8A|nr:DCN1-like protein 3 [Eurytemora carolleeae]|eukprot:XP_023327148.1 DCN1-like protein 3 [Eurytemora affinis]
MGNLCSFCLPCQSVKNKIKLSQRFSETPNAVCGIEEDVGLGEGLLETQLYSNEETIVQAPVHPSISLKFDGMIVKDLSNSGSSSTSRTEKKSLALKLSGTLNRNNSESRTFSESKIQQLFEKYKDETEDAILSEGVEQLCIDLQLKPDEFKVLVLAWKFEAEMMCRFTRQEFIKGCKALKVDTLKGIQNKLPEIAAAIVNDHELFKELYRFTFKFGLDQSSGQRILPVDMAVSLWLLVFSQQEPPILKRWVYFLEKHPQVRGIPRDTWFMFLNFVQSVGNDLTQYDDTEAWPSLFDDFVEFENDQLNQNSSAMLDLNRESSLTPS